MRTDMQQLFVFGTLKQGFCNFAFNRGLRLGGDWVTVQPYPLYISGADRLPWLLERPGQGLPVVGQLFEVDEAMLAELDRFEQVDEPLWYQRRRIQLRPHPGGLDAEAVDAWVYFGGETGFAGAQVHAGPMHEYTLAVAAQHAVTTP